MTFLGGTFLILLWPIQWRIRNPTEVTIPGKNRKKRVRAAPQVWPSSMRALALRTVDTLFQIPKMIPLTINSVLRMQVRVRLGDVSVVVSDILFLFFLYYLYNLLQFWLVTIIIFFTFQLKFDWAIYLWGILLNGNVW